MPPIKIARFAGRELPANLAYETNFANLDEFWWEGTPEVSASGGSLFIRTKLQRDANCHHVSTVFLKRPFKGDLFVEYEGRSIHDESHRNFNFFVHAKTRDGRGLYETRGERTGDYPEYHVMDNYLFTCLKSDQQNPDGSDMFRYRMRRDPGFHLMKEAHAYRCENHRWYAFQYLIRKGEVGVCIDRLPHEAYTWLDPQPLAEGHIGFRSFQSHLEFRNLKVWAVG